MFKATLRYPVYVLVALCFGLLVYSAVLLSMEWRGSEATVRPYFSDIVRDVNEPRLFAVNTTLTMSLLGATGFCFLLAFSFSDRSTCLRHKLFFLSQGAFFAYLGFDDRFKMHELLGQKLGIYDHYILLTLGVAQLVCVALLGRTFVLRPLAFGALVVASGFFAVMILFDGFLPQDMTCRLSMEDLAKVWSALAFLVYGWAVLRQHVSVPEPGEGASIGE